MSLLFTLQARPGEEYASDSLDSDYYPGRESSDEDVDTLRKTRRHHIKSRKRTKVKTPKSSPNNRKLRKTAVQNNDRSSEIIHHDVQLHLPPEVMIKIFQLGIAAEGFTNFIPRVIRVNKEWNRIASDPCMVQRLDLDIHQIMLTKKNQPSLMNLLKRDVSHCHQLILHGQIHLSPSVIEHILSLMPRLKTLNLHSCIVKPGLIKQLPQLCPLIQRIDLSSQAGSNRNFPLTSVKDLIKSFGANLVELRLANSATVRQYPWQVLESILENCPNLEELDVGIAGIVQQHNHSFTASMESLALGCPKLRELRLDGFVVLDKLLTQKPGVDGFKNLQVYSQSTQIHQRYELPAFYRLVCSLSKLKMLNISRSRLLPSRVTQWIKEVEDLCLQDMRWAEDEEPEMVHCIASWSSSLRSLDLSYNKPVDHIIEKALSKYGKAVQPDGYPLQILNLSNSNVTPQSIIRVIHSCKNLTEINLTSCRELPRGTKREFKREEFNVLLKSLHPFVQENADNNDDVSLTSDSDSDVG